METPIQKSLMKGELYARPDSGGNGIVAYDAVSSGHFYTVLDSLKSALFLFPVPFIVFLLLAKIISPSPLKCRYEISLC